MKFKIFITLIVYLIVYLIVCPILNAKASVLDTMNVNLPDIKVVDDKISSGILNFYSNTLIDYSRINRVNAVQVSELLSNSPGVFIKNYGGYGGLKTISIRGASAAETSILLDGVPINSSQSGTFDLSLFPASLITGVEIIRGGAGAIFGGGAMGGAVNLKTDIKQSDSLKLKLSYASFNSSYAAISGGFSSQVSNFLIASEYVYSKGNYPFYANMFGENKLLNRENGDFSNFSVAIFNTNKLNDKDLKLNFKILASAGERGSPGAVLQGKVEAASARLADDIIYLFTSLQNNISSNARYSFLISSKYQYTKYSDPDLYGDVNTGEVQNYFNRDISLSGNLDYSFSGFYNQFYFNFGISDLRGDMLQEYLNKYISRKFLALSYKSETGFDIFCLKSSLTGAIRYDNIQNAGDAFSPLFAFTVTPIEKLLKFRFQYSHNFRAPNFNESYYLNFGNKDLKPERSNSFNFGLNSIIFERFIISGEYFIINAEDKIVAVPKSPISWSASNLSKSENTGFELSLQTQIPEIYITTVNFNYTLQKPVDKTPNSPGFNKLLVYSPEEIISGEIRFELDSYSLGSSFDYSSLRYYTQDNDINAFLPSYMNLNVYITKDLNLFGFKTTLRFDCLNLLDESYCVVNNYPMPGRNFKLSLNIKK